MSESDSQAVMVDAQGSMVTVLRPPTGFEGWYQGNSSAVPVALVPPDEKGRYLAVERGAGIEPDLEPRLQRYLPVPRDGRIVVWFPRIMLTNGTITLYQYQFHWRLRTVKCAARLGQPYSLVPRNGVPSGSDPRLIIPSAMGQVVTPSSIGLDVSPYAGGLVPSALSNGLFVTRDTYYEPQVITARGDEMLLTVSRVDLIAGNWDFTSTALDGAFSNIFGSNLSGTPHPVYDGIGVLVYTTTSESD